MKKSIFSIIMILVGILIIVTGKIIDDFNWYLRSDFLWLASFLITLGIFLLGLFLLRKIKNKVLKIFLSIFWTLMLIVVAFVEFMLLCWFIKPTIIKEIDGVEYCGVEYITNRLRKNVYYYKEYNNSYITFVFYSTSSPQAVFALLYNENIIIPKVFQEGGDLYTLDGKNLKNWNSRNYSGSKTSEELQAEKIKNHETIYLYAKYE